MIPILERLPVRFKSRATLVFVHDLAMIALAWIGAWWIRFDLSIPPEYMNQALSALPAMALLQGVAFLHVGLYRGMWRFISLSDLSRIFKATLFGVFAGVAALFLINRMNLVPRSIFPLYGLLLILMISGPRLLYRWIKEHYLQEIDSRKALVVGAGAAGEMLVQDLLRDPSYGCFPVGIVDDNPGKRGREIHGVRVLGGGDRIPEFADRTGAEIVLLALPSATTAQIRRIVGFCEKAGVAIRTLPRMHDMPGSGVAVSGLRSISIEDLLSRPPISLDRGSIERGISGRVIAVTGGGGSIGSELCRQIAGFGPRRLMVLDHSEYNLYTIERDLRERFPRLDLDIILGDICDERAVRHTFTERSPDIVFHAAAYKHVPMLEREVREAIRVNVFGTECVAKAAAAARVGKFVLISTDKAVNPANIMGASKYVAERICADLARTTGSPTRFITIRFGNVLGSAGSVVSLFRSQIEQGGPVTVTHPEIERYFMTIAEACQLVMEAGSVGEGGEVFVLDMGEPVKIRYLAEQMIWLSGKVPGEGVPIEFIGLRAGEKLIEELFHPEENPMQTQHDKLLLARLRPCDVALFEKGIDDLRFAWQKLDESEMRRLLALLASDFSDGAKDARVLPFDFLRRPSGQVRR